MHMSKIIMVTLCSLLTGSININTSVFAKHQLRLFKNNQHSSELNSLKYHVRKSKHNPQQYYTQSQSSLCDTREAFVINLPGDDN